MNIEQNGMSENFDMRFAMLFYVESDENQTTFFARNQ